MLAHGSQVPCCNAVFMRVSMNVAERVGFEPAPGIESTQLTDFACRSCRWNRSNRRSRVQFRYRLVARMSP